METIKPTFNVCTAVTTIEVDGVVYNASPLSGNWHQLRDGDYTEGFKQGIMIAQVNLIHSGYVNKGIDNKLASKHTKGIVQIARNNLVTGNTALYGGNTGSEWIFAQDLPEVKEGRIEMNQDTLVARLESEDKRIINDHLHISADGQVRAMKREGFRNGEYTVEQMLASNQPTFITGDKQAPRKMADMMKTTNKPGYLSIPSHRIITVPGLGVGDDRLDLCSFWSGFFDGRCSFGVRQ